MVTLQVAADLWCVCVCVWVCVCVCVCVCVVILDTQVSLHGGAHLSDQQSGWH